MPRRDRLSMGFPSATRARHKPRASRSPRASGIGLVRLHRTAITGHRERECTPLPLGRVHPDASAVCFDDRPGDAQSETSTPRRRRTACVPEAVEDVRHDIRRYSRPVIGHRDDDLVLGRTRCEGDMSSPGTNFPAFDRRLPRAWRIRSASITTGGSGAGTSSSNSIPASASSGANVACARSSTPIRLSVRAPSRACPHRCSPRRADPESCGSSSRSIGQPPSRARPGFPR